MYHSGSHRCDPTPDRNDPEEDLVHNVSGCSPQVRGPCACTDYHGSKGLWEGSSLPHSGQEVERKEEAFKDVHRGLLPLARPHPLKLLPLLFLIYLFVL